MAKPSKYAHVLPNLPKFVTADIRYQAKVDLMKQQVLQDASPDPDDPVTELPSLELAKMVVLQRIVKAELKAQMYQEELKLEATQQLMIDQFEEDDAHSVHVTAGSVGAAVRTQSEPYSSVRDKDKFRQWCLTICQICGKHRAYHDPEPEEEATWEDHSPVTLEESLALPWQTTNAITKERLLAGLPEPDGVEAQAFTKVVVTRDKL